MAKNKVILRIINRQYDEHMVSKEDTYVRRLTLGDEMDLETEATVYTKKDSVYITYNESRKIEMDENRTVIKLKGNDTLEVHRYERKKTNGMDLLLRTGRTTEVSYLFPFGRMKIRIYTHELRFDLDENGMGTIYAEYSIHMGREMNKRNKLQMTIRPDHAGRTEERKRIRIR